jgi:hypothetical protein
MHSFSLKGALPSFNLEIRGIALERAYGRLAGVTISPHRQLALGS